MPRVFVIKLAFYGKWYIISLQKSSGCIAQLVEQLTLNQWVQGSSPCASTRNKNARLGVFYFCSTGRESEQSCEATKRSKTSRFYERSEVKSLRFARRALPERVPVRPPEIDTPVWVCFILLNLIPCIAFV